MNRVRMMMLMSALIIGGLGISPALAQAPSGAAPASAPRYYYGFGYAGWGYYLNPPAATAPAYRAAPAPVPAAPRMTPPAAYREAGTGRNLYLAKPWLRPLN